MKIRAVVIAIAVLFAAGCDLVEAEPTATGSAFTEAGQYCVDKGGEVQDRVPTYGTNNDPSAWVGLAGSLATCKLATMGDDTAIFVDLTTLYSEEPTLAALAYLQSSTPEDLIPSGNPASAVCAYLGGASQFGPGANGGGLVDQSDRRFTVFSPCMFADGSFIEEWGITYHQEGVIRGADLEPLFRFDTDAAPQVFD